MDFKLPFNLVQEICGRYQLGKTIKFPVLIPGSKVHQVWKLDTETGSYALKRLNVSQDPLKKAIAHYQETEKIAHAFHDRKIPIMLPHYDGCSPICVVDQECFILFDWLEAQKILPTAAMPLQAEKIGFLLATMHKNPLPIDLFNIHALRDSFYDAVDFESQWKTLLSFSMVEEMQHADLLRKTCPRILTVCEEAEKATQALRAERIISHRDISPNNVLWRDSRSPVIIDWELAGLIHPTVELIGAAFDWSIVTSSEVSLERFEALVQAYRSSGGKIERVSEAFSALMGVWFSWMAFNLHRFIHHATRAERDLGEREVIHTLLAFNKVYPERERWEVLLFGDE